MCTLKTGLSWVVGARTSCIIYDTLINKRPKRMFECVDECNNATTCTHKYLTFSFKTSPLNSATYTLNAYLLFSDMNQYGVMTMNFYVHVFRSSQFYDTVLH